MQVPHATNSAALVRRELSADLASHGIDAESIDEVVLVASELVGNAVRHTHAVEGIDVGVDWTLADDAVTVQVSDPSAVAPTRRDPSATEPGGRGLQIVAALSDDWGVRPSGHGKRVWAHVPVRHAALAG